MAGAGLTAEQYACYSILHTYGPLTVSQFAEHAHLPLTTASDVVRSMERRDHVTRVRDDADRRAWLLELSPAGQQAHAVARDTFRSVARQVSQRLGDAEPAVREALQALADACSAVSRDQVEPGAADWTGSSRA
jgi:DNA-binding MarR family transcriptional regulator